MNAGNCTRFHKSGCRGAAETVGVSPGYVLLVRMHNKAGFSLTPILDHSSATLATASSIAPRSCDHPPESRRDAQEDNTLLFLYEPGTCRQSL